MGEKIKTLKIKNNAKVNAYSIKEEIANSITHGIGILFSVVTLTILLVYAIWNKSTLSIIAFSIYGLCSLCLFTSSTLYHSLQNTKVKKLFRLFDHASIFLFIAGTYTPVALLSMTGLWRAGILTSVWAIAILGIGFKILTYNKYDKFKMVTIILYVIMGWLVVFAIKPILQMVPKGFFIWLLVGGIAYTVGTIFYANKRIPYNHAIWHIFVLGGCVAHFLGIFLYLV